MRLIQGVASSAVVLAAMIGVASFSVPAHAGTITVSTTADELDSPEAGNGLCSLREAIMSVNMQIPFADCPVTGELGSADTVMLPAGTYELTRSGSCDDFNESGDLDILTSVTIVGAGAQSTIVSGNTDVEAGDRVFDIVYDMAEFMKAKDLEPIPLVSMNVTVEKLTIRDGKTSYECEGPFDRGEGAGIRNGMDMMGGKITSVGKNVLPMPSSLVTLRDVMVLGNRASYDGGGIANLNQMVIENSTIAANATYYNGGGIFNLEKLTIINSTISGNAAEISGGGIAFYDSSLTNLRNVTITANLANALDDGSGNGGGISAYGEGDVEMPKTVKPLFDTAEVMIRNSIIAGNHAGTVESGELSVHPDCSIPFPMLFVSEGYNVIGDNRGCSTSDGPSVWDASDQVGDVLAGGAVLDAGLLPLAANGGGTFTHTLTVTSIALDKGNSVVGCTSDDAQTVVIANDQRGEARPQDANQDGTVVCDVGAYEFRPVVCGDARVEAAEQCDDGNAVDGDGCSATCTNEVTPACGDGILQAGEACDDQNATDGDGCSSTCAIENAAAPAIVALPADPMTYLLGEGGCTLVSGATGSSTWIGIVMMAISAAVLGIKGRSANRE